MNSNSFLYGKGIFSTVAIRDGKALLWDKHWARLRSNAEIIGIPFEGVDQRELLIELEKHIKERSINNGRARLTFFDERSSEIWPAEISVEQHTSHHIIVGERRQIPENFKLTVSPYPVNSRSPLAGVKSCNYLENLISFENAKTGGFNEAIRLNERGEITSACMANVFWLRENSLYTPSLKTGCLAGTTREFVLEKVECSEVETGIEELEKADAIFLTSAGVGIAGINEFDGTILRRPDHPLLRLV